MAFYKIKARTTKAYTDDVKYIERKDREPFKTVYFTIFSKDKVNAIGVAAKKLAADGFTHEGVEIVQ